LKYAILGSGGCFGLNLARYLISQGHEVIGIGRSPLKGPAFTLGARFPYHVYSVGPDTEFIAKLLWDEKPETIVNFAAQGEGAWSFQVDHWKYFYRTNVTALVELTEWLSGAHWLQRFIHISTSELYGSVDKPATEESPLVCTSPYSASKAGFDLHLQAIARLGFPMNIVRPSNCYCEGQQLHRIIPKTVVSALNRITLPLHGGGVAEKSYLHATDLSGAISTIADKAPLGEIYNVGPERPISIRDLVGLCAEACIVDTKWFVRDTEDRPGQDAKYWLDSSKIRGLGWKPFITLKEGIDGMARWALEYKYDLKISEFRMRA
jgi:dTDP-glucose 4,6-dehydratase